MAPELIARAGRLSRRRLLAGLAGLSAGAVVAACSPAAAPSPTTAPAKPTAAPAATTAPAKPAETAKPAAQPTAKPAAAAPGKATPLKKFKIGVAFPQYLYAHMYVAKEQGFFERNGFDVEIIGVDSDQTALKAVLAKEMDWFDGTPAGMLTSVEQGSDLKVLGAVAKGSHFLMYAKKEIKDVPDLVGKTVAISAPNAYPHVLVLGVVSEAKIDPSKINFVAVGAQGLIPSLVSGAVDASSAAVQFKPAVEKEPNLHVVFPFIEKLPKMINAAHITSGENVRSRADDMVAIMTAMVQGGRFVLDPKNKPAVATAVGKYASLTPADVDFNWQWFVENKIYQPDGLVTADDMDFMQQLNILIGTQKAKLPIERVLAPEIQQRVIQAIGPYRG